MRIALLNDPNNFHTQKWATALEGAGNEVIVFSFDQDRGSGLRSVTLTPPGGGPDFNYRAYLQTGPQLLQAFQQHDIDLVNALNVTPFGVWAARAGHRPFIASAIGADILEYPPKLSMSPVLRQRSWAHSDAGNSIGGKLKRSLGRKYYRARVKEALEAADLITGDNQQLVDAVRDWFGIAREKVRLHRWGVEPELFDVGEKELADVRAKWGIREDHRIILSPRGAKPVYNGDTIVEAFGQLLEGGFDKGHILMLGSGYDIPKAVERQASDLESRFPNFSFVRESLPRKEVYALWNLVDIFVNVPAYDGYSAALAEGRYIGAIPLVNDIPAHRELIDHMENGWMISQTSPDSISEGIWEIMSQKDELRERFAAKNRKWIVDHSLISQNAFLFSSWAEELLQQNSL